MAADDHGEREASASLGMTSSPTNSSCLPQVGSALSPVGPSCSMPSGSSHIWRFDSDLMVEHSPTAHSLSNPAPSDCHSEVFSSHDDASSSLATMSAADRTITVNTQRARMGEHLKGKLEGMIRQRFENYLQIVHVLQNDTGKLAALECELRAPFTQGLSAGTEDESARVPPLISISCNEDGTFLVYTAPDVAAVPSPVPATSSSLQEYPPGSSLHGEEEAAPMPPGAELLRRWVEQVCEFGMSGRCHSLTALFHFGYNASKQLQGAGGDASLAFYEANPLNVSGISGRNGGTNNRGFSNGVSSMSPGRDVPSKIAEEERPREEFRDEYRSAPLRDDFTQPPLLESLGEEPKEVRPVGMLLKSAQLAIDCEQFYQALDLCSEGLAMVQPLSADSAGPSSTNGSPAAAAADASASSTAVSRSAAALGSRQPEADPESAAYVQQFLLLRASAQSSLRHYDLALQDAEKLISLNPTCAEGYYWQSVALQGLDHSQEALEALMSALEYDPQNSSFQHAFTALFEEISASAGRFAEPAARPVLHGRRSRGGQLGDALSTTTQATHLSSRSTTPTEVSAAPSRSSSQDSLYVIGTTTEDPPT